MTELVPYHLISMLGILILFLLLLFVLYIVSLMSYILYKENDPFIQCALCLLFELGFMTYIFAILSTPVKCLSTFFFSFCLHDWMQCFSSGLENTLCTDT